MYNTIRTQQYKQYNIPQISRPQKDIAWTRDPAAELPQPSSDDLEIRICGSGSISTDEDVIISMIDYYYTPNFCKDVAVVNRD